MDNLSNKFNVTKLEKGVRLSTNEYYDRMLNSKIILAPFGFGSYSYPVKTTFNNGTAVALPMRNDQSGSDGSGGGSGGGGGGSEPEGGGYTNPDGPRSGIENRGEQGKAQK